MNSYTTTKINSTSIFLADDDIGSGWLILGTLETTSSALTLSFLTLPEFSLLDLTLFCVITSPAVPNWISWKLWAKTNLKWEKSGYNYLQIKEVKGVFMVHKWDRPCWIILYLQFPIGSCTRYSRIPSPWIKWQVHLLTNGLGVHDRTGGHQAIATDMLQSNFWCEKLFISIL